MDGRIERLAEEIEGHREVAAQIEKEQRVCDVLLKLVGIGVTGIASWDSHRLEALETLVYQVNDDEMTKENGKE